MDNTTLTRKWIEFIGKGKLQSLQDMLAEILNISFGLLDLEGRPITVSSKPSLLCHHIRKSKKEICDKEFTRIFDKCKLEKEAIKSECCFGLKYFLFPVFSNDNLVAVFYVGAFYENENPLTIELQKKFCVPVITEETIEKIRRVILPILNILDFEVELKDKLVDDAPSETDEICAPILFDGKLSKRECDVAMLVCDGCSNKSIAEKLYISEKTVKTHISNILNKLECKDRMQIMLFGRR